jgi:hypothetical protein
MLILSKLRPPLGVHWVVLLPQVLVTRGSHANLQEATLLKSFPISLCTRSWPSSSRGGRHRCSDSCPSTIGKPSTMFITCPSSVPRFKAICYKLRPSGERTPTTWRSSQRFRRQSAQPLSIGSFRLTTTLSCCQRPFF